MKHPSFPRVTFKLGALLTGALAMLFVSGCATSPFAETGKVTTMRVALAKKTDHDITYRIAVGRVLKIGAENENPALVFNTTTVSGAPSSVTVKAGQTDAEFTIQPEKKLCNETLLFVLSPEKSRDVAGVGTIAVKTPDDVACEDGTNRIRTVRSPISVGRK